MDVLTATVLSLDFTVCCVCAQHITSLFHLQVSRSKRVTAKNCLIPIWTRNHKILDSEPNTIVKRDFGGPSEGESIFCTCFCFVCSVAKLCPILCDLMDSSTPGFPDLHHLLKFAQIHVHLSQWHYLSILSSAAPFFWPQSLPASFHIRWPKYWSFSFSISPSNEYSGLISFRMDWFDLLAVQGTLKSLLQHHNSKASVL